LLYALIHTNRKFNIVCNICTFMNGNRDRSVDIATGYGTDGWGSIRGREKSFLFSIASRPAHPASYPMAAGGDFPRVKEAGA
jgi:hypothetical protein